MSNSSGSNSHGSSKKPSTGAGSKKATKSSSGSKGSKKASPNLEGVTASSESLGKEKVKVQHGNFEAIIEKPAGYTPIRVRI